MISPEKQHQRLFSRQRKKRSMIKLVRDSALVLLTLDMTMAFAVACYIAINGSLSNRLIWLVSIGVVFAVSLSVAVYAQSEIDRKERDTFKFYKKETRK